MDVQHLWKSSDYHGEREELSDVFKKCVLLLQLLFSFVKKGYIMVLYIIFTTLLSL